jgi:hypothetical protein
VGGGMGAVMEDGWEESGGCGLGLGRRWNWGWRWGLEERVMINMVVQAVRDELYQSEWQRGSRVQADKGGIV